MDITMRGRFALQGFTFEREGDFIWAIKKNYKVKFCSVSEWHKLTDFGGVK